ncbi:outer membrane protein assembly factor BamE [Sulfitobacter delicatus]|jgi:outer membrane protein assembly factor BamE (lipoprotein component of BamABCDE complex)|uniref:Outer membrane protein assembly factor BamE, lipoprotein component of the BamABCDE complex n=1 Tax=Sulfitobacter delicatus TaxID=218672 RepID=A0A1G7QL61_9RHOB|nr:outer membrane protein assembly factor BamE [Sulfitobacter delicatus]SDF98639.1 Outer membrane protein assembly factor BamE, lipoprotein component of the BamABCDE complex [Sulfitobacter delicatus]
MRITKPTGTTSLRAGSLGLLLLLGACAPQYENHGYVPPADQLEQVVVGNDTKESVAEKIGVPTAGGLLNDDSYYYVKMRKRALGFLAPKEINREVVAISFNNAGVVENVERFGLEKGQVVPLSRRVTSSPVKDKSFLRQLMGNLGRFSPTAFGS